MKSYKYKDKIYTITNCVTDDIPFHLERVLSYLHHTEIEAYVLRMDEAIYCGTAYKLVDENNNTKVFAYYEQKDDQKVHGISLWWESIRMFSIFGVWFRSYTHNKEVHIMPHKNNFISFSFLIEDSSIKSYHFNKTSLYIDLYSDKSYRISNLYEKMKVTEV